MGRVEDASSDAPPSRGNAARLATRDWIEAALRRLAVSNVDDVRIEVIARDLKVTKGSFYWHFRNRQDLLEKMLEHWTDWATVQITRWASSEGADERERLERLLSLPARSRPDKHGADIELAIRSWARHDPLAADTVRKVDGLRAAFFRELLAGLGLKEEVLTQRVAIAQAFMLGEALLKTGQDQAARLANVKACAALLTARPQETPAAAAHDGPAL